MVKGILFAFCAFLFVLASIFLETSLSPRADAMMFITPPDQANVLFLPGIKASRLYKNGLPGTDDQLWPPNYFGNDLKDLALDGNGKSVNAVFTKDILDQIAWGIGGNIYQSFADDLSNLKTAGTIKDYKLFAYDWRQNVEDVAENGTPYPDGAIGSAVDDVKSLADSAWNGKVTIVAHSDGGLLAKAVMRELEKQGKAGLVGTVVLVDAPQMGTPLSILSLLYGYDEAILGGTLVSREDARTLAWNMPGAYGLLPSKTYFDRMESPFITFSSEHTRYKSFKDAYGDGIDTVGELDRFLSGEDDKRSTPAASDVELENTLRTNLLTEAKETHDRLDDWTPPAGVKVIEIAGWGLDTVSGVDYKEEAKETRTYVGELTRCVQAGEYDPIYEPKFTVDGDRVVTAPSSLMLPSSDRVTRYWVDLWSYNKVVAKGRSHSDILEADPVRTFLGNMIKNVPASLPEYFHDSRPDDHDNASPRIRMSLYSPLDINVTDAAGNHTGPKLVDGHVTYEESIPDSYYYQYGDRKYVGFPEGSDVHVEMDGYAEGPYTLKLVEVKPTTGGEETTGSATFADLPTTAKTKVTFAIPSAGLAGMSALSADVDGDGTNDYVLPPVLGGTTSLPDRNSAQPGVSPTTTTSGSNGHHADNKKKSAKKPVVNIATATPDGSRPTLATNLFPDPTTPSGKYGTIAEGNAGKDSKGTGESGIIGAWILRWTFLKSIAAITVALIAWFGWRLFIRRKIL